ncbi:MAG: transposase [Patescibacteria group bacterium]|nr:transposase [Patescibacteria group bacterium]
MTPKLEQVVRVWEVVAIERHVSAPLGRWGGRPAHDRCLLARAFVAKAVYDLATTTALIELLKTNRSLRILCGFESIASIPSEATFSRAFDEFSAYGLADMVHAALVHEHIGDQIVMHASYDSTEVVARERPVQKEKKAKEKRKRGRPKKGEERPAPEPKRLDIQLKQTAQEAFRDLPKGCDFGTKNDTSGHKHTWKGYKAHIAWSDGGIPIAVATTSASVHDSQVVIPLMRTVASRVTSLYDLADSAYDAPQIRQVSRQLGHVPIVDANPRRGEVSEEKLFDPAMSQRYKERTTAERGNSRLKDEFGLRHLRVRGNPKVHLHIMLGIVALFADQLLKPLTG